MRSRQALRRPELIGNVKRRAVVIDVKGLKAGAAQNGVFVNGADDVSVHGFHARNYKANGFFVVNADGYTLDRLVRRLGGVYGIYAFNSKGGKMSELRGASTTTTRASTSARPRRRRKPKRTIVKNVNSWGNVLGWSGTNMRYVTITKSRWYNNGAGHRAQRARRREVPAAEDNVITDNDVFWNNFNYYFGRAVRDADRSAADLPLPDGRRHPAVRQPGQTVERNRFFGNYLAELCRRSRRCSCTATTTRSSRRPPCCATSPCATTRSASGGNDLNGRDMVYDGSGSGNCFEGN